jgi:hypothetical protein
MFKRLGILLTLAALLLPTILSASEPGYRTRPVRVTGKRLRKQVRYLLYEEYLENDKLRIYNDFGYCRHRLRERGYGGFTERWIYYEHGLKFVFDENGYLIRTKRFFPEDKRERFTHQ